MEPRKPKFSGAFYEDAGDLLAGFRKKHGGARFVKKGGDPFAKDPDVVQSERQSKLVNDISNMDISSSGW